MERRGQRLLGRTMAKPAWQHDTGCARRTVADVSAVADPNTGVAVYDSTSSGGSGWMVFGGTSAASPIIAAIYALAGATGRGPARQRRSRTPTRRTSTT